MADWKYVITNLGGTDSVELLGARQRKLTKPLNNMATLDYTLDVDHKLADRILTTDALCKAYRRPLGTTSWGAPFFTGEVAGAEENADDQDPGSVKVTHADPLFRLFRRFVGAQWGADGKAIGFGFGTAAGPIDKALVPYYLLSYANSISPTGVEVGALPLTGSLIHLGQWYFKKVAEGLIETANTLGGYDFDLRYIEPAGAWPNTTLCYLDEWPVLGAIRQNAIFEYGFGKRNAKGYKRAVDRSGLCNGGWSLPSGWPDSAAAGEVPAFYGDIPSAAAHGFYEDVVPGDLTGSLRQQLVDAHVAVRKVPRNQVTFTIVPDASPDYGVAYKVGDVVTARARVGNSMRINGLVRVYGAAFNVDDSGVESIDLTLIPQA